MIARQLTLGQLIAAELVVALIVTGVSKLGKHLELFYDLNAAIDKLGYLTDLPTEDTEGESLPDNDGPASIAIRNLSLAKDGRAPLFDGIDLDVSPGRRIGLVANRGAARARCSR